MLANLKVVLHQCVDANVLHAAVVELVAHKNAEIKYSNSSKIGIPVMQKVKVVTITL